MKINLTGRKLEITDALRERLNKKLGKLDKYFGPSTEADVVLLVEKNRHIIEVTVQYSSMIFRAEESSYDMYSSIDRVIEVLERQIRKNKTRLEKRLRASAFVPDAQNDALMHVDEEQEFKIARSKRFPIKPMSVEEAILQMNLLGHEFYVFKRDDSGDINVVYKRKNGDYGLIETE